MSNPLGYMPNFYLQNNLSNFREFKTHDIEKPKNDYDNQDSQV